jgi:hypothetical protein
MHRIKVATILCGLAFRRAAPITLSIAKGQETTGAMHAHLSGVSCDDVPPSEKRPDFQ